MDGRNNKSFNRGRGGGGDRYRNVGRGRFSYPPDGSSRRYAANYSNNNNNNNNNSGPREVRFVNQNARGSRIPRGRGAGHNRHSVGSAVDPDSQWFRVEIPHTENGKEFVLRSINASLDTPLTPFNYHEEGTTTVFFVDGSSTSETLRGLSMRVTKPDGYKMKIIVKPSTAPQTTLDESLSELIKLVMSRRFAADLGYLDLSNFRRDEAFLLKELYVALDRPVVVKEVVKVIIENIPNLKILNLADNRLKYLEPLSKMKGVCSLLKAINLSKNKVQDVKELDHIKGLDLDEIWLKDNPCPSFKDQTQLIRKIRDLFPNIKKLDGEDLPAAIGFDVEVKTQVPPTQGSFIPEQVKEFAEQFLKHFYDIYDSDERQGLMAAYHDNACFSYSIIARGDANPKQGFAGDLIKESRNLMRVNNTETRIKHLKRGKVNIIAALNSLPQTKHATESFVIDVPFSTTALVNIVINGLVVETWKKQKALRSFTRSLSIIPFGGGFVIINDLLLLTNSSYDQRNKFSSIVKLIKEEASGTSTVNRDQLVTKLRQQTGMNESFSRQCLEESNYDYARAVDMFTQLNGNGMIPPEAFSQTG